MYMFIYKFDVSKSFFVVLINSKTFVLYNFDIYLDIFECSFFKNIVLFITF